MYKKHLLKSGVSLVLTAVLLFGLFISIPVFASNELYKFTFTPAEKLEQETWFVPSSASEVVWDSGSGMGFDDDFVLRANHIDGESYANADNAIRLNLPEPLPAGASYDIRVSYYVPSELNQNKSWMLGLGIVLNGDYSNTEYNLPSSPWSSGFIQMDTWRTLSVSTPVMTEDIRSIDFRFWGDSESSHPDAWYIDNIVIVRPEWDLTLPSLAEAYKDSFMIGNVISPHQMDADTTAMYKLHYNVVTAENSMKPMYLSSGKGQYDFSGAEPIVTWAQENGLLLHGHTLVWHSQSASWLTNNPDKTPVTREEARENMEEFISNVAGYYAGKVISWDVVNEAFDGGSLPFDDWRDVLRKGSPWYRAYENGADTTKGESGADYIYDAFVFARLADPNAVLEYNDYNETDDWKREAMALMAEELNEKWKTDPRNTDPSRKLIEGLGMQSHHHTEHPDVSEIEKTIQRFIKAGVRITASELDVPVGHYNGPTSPILTYEQQVEQAIYYARLFEYYKAYDAHITRVTFWGHSDNRSWRGDYSPQLFDRTFAAKEAFYAVLDPSGYLMEKGLTPRSLYDLTISADPGEIFAGDPADITVNATAEGIGNYNVIACLEKDGIKYSDEFQLINGTGTVSISETLEAGQYRIIVDVYDGDILLASKAVPLLIKEDYSKLPFILRNENFAFHERTDALIIDAKKEVIGSSLNISDWSAHVRATRIVDPSYVWYDGPREIIDVYVSKVNDVGYPSDTGQYIVIDFPDVGWDDGGYTNDGGYTFDSQYTITFSGTHIDCADGTQIIPEAFVQTGVVSPVLDKFKYANYDGLDYSYFWNDEIDEPLPLVIFNHGGGQGNDIYTPIRFSNGGTVWANPENQARYPCHVLAPRNATTAAAMQKVKALVDTWIADGKVDPNRIYITGFSMGGGATWTFLQNFPDVPAAAAPICPAGGPGNVENALKVAYLPLWTFVDDDDFLYGMVVNTYNTYSQYWNDSMLTVFPENKLNNPPYNGWVFDPHCSWLPAYNEYVDPEHGMLIDWFFSKSKIRGIEDVAVETVPGVAPVLPETVIVSVNHNDTGIVPEERAVVWDEIDPQSYASPGVFTVQGKIEGCVEKATAQVTVASALENAVVLKGAAEIQSGSEFIVEVDMENVCGNVYAEDIVITYNSQLFTLLDVEAAEDVEIIVPNEETELEPGILRIIAFNTDALTGNDSLFKLKFQASEAIGQTGVISVSSAELGVAPEGTVIKASGGILSVSVSGIPVTGVSLDKTTLTLSEIGQSKTLTATVEPADATNKNVTWSTSNPSVAVVDNGVVTAVGEGTAVITVTTEDGGFTADCTVTVTIDTTVPVEGVSLDKTSLYLTKIGQSAQLTATVEPANATNKNVTWSSSNTDVAVVEDGVVTAVGNGEAIITVTTEDGGKTATCTVTVLIGDLNGNDSIDIGDLAIAAYYYHADSSSENWPQAQIADVNNDGIVDIIDLAIIARSIID
ncbi:MAG: hypothetical protein GX211_07815 [Clostridiaceae bacterium]|jgi:GH35 family endo-1,4-beta-xylanase/uncharacterized protein YjdB/pimeloyl-ACP methyl ester carboxylesterase|nr:hypothetical protein [Clostridiaceae bacterium]